MIRLSDSLKALVETALLSGCRPEKARLRDERHGSVPTDDKTGEIKGEHMLFSIIVPVYRVEAYLKRCVRSLIDQTHSDSNFHSIKVENKICCVFACQINGYLEMRMINNENYRFLFTTVS